MMGRPEDLGWDAVRSQPSYRAFIWVYRVWLAMMVGFTVTLVVRSTVSALWVAALGACAGVLLVILLAVSLRRAGVPVLMGLTDRELARVIIFDDLLG